LYNALSVYAAIITMDAAMIAIYLDITEIGMYWLNDFVPKKVYSIGINIIKEKILLPYFFLAIPIIAPMNASTMISPWGMSVDLLDTILVCAEGK